MPFSSRDQQGPDTQSLFCSQPSRQQCGSRCPATAVRTTSSRSSTIITTADARMPMVVQGRKASPGNAVPAAYTLPRPPDSATASTDPAPAQQCRHHRRSRPTHIEIGHRRPSPPSGAQPPHRCPTAICLLHRRRGPSTHQCLKGKHHDRGRKPQQAIRHQTRR